MSESTQFTNDTQKFTNVTEKDKALFHMVTAGDKYFYSLCMILNTYLDHKNKTKGDTRLWFPTTEIVNHIKEPRTMNQVMERLRLAASLMNGTNDMFWCYLHGIHCLPPHDFEIIGYKTYQDMFELLDLPELTTSEGSKSKCSELLRQTVFKYDEELDLELNEKKRNYIHSLMQLNTLDPQTRHRWIADFPRFYFHSIELDSETEHQPMITHYFERMEYILNTLTKFKNVLSNVELEMQERPNVKAAGQKKYRISVFGKPRSYIPDNVLFFKNKNDDQRVKEVKNEKT
ncbi:unnamed protein product [Ambrosiozyma monospora]|uniref:Unnamed protein product n=1 Tax=Ambrosiozyma monospora TaxID=43982 RepID=A0A9W6Z2T2_AMBMO|nr:unnamed protein product [Ambrosiozyma monospora]